MRKGEKERRDGEGMGKKGTDVREATVCFSDYTMSGMIF